MDTPKWTRKSPHLQILHNAYQAALCMVSYNYDTSRKRPLKAEAFSSVAISFSRKVLPLADRQKSWECDRSTLCEGQAILTYLLQ